MVKGTVETVGCGSYVTVPFAKKRQRHGRNRRLWGAGDRAFCKKAAKARSEVAVDGRARPCLLGKNGEGTVRNREAKGVADRAFWKKSGKGTVNGHRRPRIGAFGAGRSRPDGRRLVNKQRIWCGAIDKCLRHPNQPPPAPKPLASCCVQ